MSGFGTQKMPTTDLNLGFPTAFQNAYKGSVRFAPDPPEPRPVLLEGNDFQADYHAQKKRDADYMVKAKVLATRNMNNRANVSHAGYYEMPKPVLGQRKFANPSNGDIQPYSGRQDWSSGAPWTLVGGGASGSGVYGAGELEGGVLRTPAGMAFGKQKLMARIQQLNAIDEAKQNFFADGVGRPSAFVGAEAQPSEKLAYSTQVELAQTLEDVLNILTIGINFANPLGDLRNIQQQTAKALPPIIRTATSGSEGEINDVLEYIQGGQGRDGIAQLLADTQQNIVQRNLQVAQPGLAEIVTRLIDVYERIEQYLTKMLQVANNPAKDRENASKALVKSLKFSQAARNFGATTPVPVQTGEENREYIADLPNPARADRAPQDSGAFIAPTRPQARPNQVQRRAGILRQFDAYDEDIGTAGSDDRSTASSLSTFGSSQPSRSTYGHLVRRVRPMWSAAGMSREDSEHGGAAAGARFSASTRDGFGAGLGTFGDSTRRDPLGRMPAYLGEYEGEEEDDAEALARGYAGGEDEEDVAEGEEGEEAAAPAPGGAMGMRAVARGEETGEPDIETGRSAAAAPRRDIVVPDWRDAAALRAWITRANNEIDGFKHKPHAGSNPRMIRQAVVVKLQKLGYNPTRG